MRGVTLLERYYIELSKKKLKMLQENIWADNYFDAILTVDSQNYVIKLGLRGNQLRKHKKKSYNILFEQPYFMEGEHEIHLNAEFNDPSLMRNKLSFEFFNQIGVLAPNAKYILLYVNQVCQGIYLKLESFDQYYLSNRNLADGSIYYATNDDANFSLYTPEGNIKKSLLDGYTIKHPFQKEDALMEMMFVINTYSKKDFCTRISTLLDVQKYLSWLVGVVCTQNFDGFIHNYALYHNSKTELFEITPWDYDGTWGRNLHGEPLEYNFVPIEGYNTLTARLLDCPNSRRLYIGILENVLQVIFTAASLEPQIIKIQTSILPYIEYDPYIKNNRKLIEGEKDYILKFIKERNQYLSNELKKNK